MKCSESLSNRVSKLIRRYIDHMKFAAYMAFCLSHSSMFFWFHFYHCISRSYTRPLLTHVARMGEERGVYRVLVGKQKGRRPLGRPRRRWVDNIRLDLQEV